MLLLSWIILNLKIWKSAAVLTKTEVLNRTHTNTHPSFTLAHTHTHTHTLSWSAAVWAFAHAKLWGSLPMWIALQSTYRRHKSGQAGAMKDLILVVFSGHGRSIFLNERSISPDTADNASSIGKRDIRRQMVSVWETLLLLETKWGSFLPLMPRIAGYHSVYFLLRLRFFFF